MPRHRAFTLLLLSLAPYFVGSPAYCQSRAEEIERELEFARGLARELAFIDLAETVLNGVENGSLDDSQKEQLALAKCDVFALGAKNELRAERREANYEKAVSAYQDFLAAHEFGDYAEEAERAYVDIANAYGVHMEGLLDDAVGEEAMRIRDRIESVLGDAVTRTGDLIDRLKLNDEPTDLQKRELYTVMFNRGQLLVTLGKASEDGTFFFDKAESILGDLALKAGERSPYGLYSYWLMGQLFSAKGEYGDASDYLEFVVDTTIPRDAELWAKYKEDIPREGLQGAWGMMEMALGPLVDAFVAEGTPRSSEEAAQFALYFYNRYQSEGFNLGPRGYLSMLSAARGLVACGGFIGGTPGNLQWFATAEEREAAGFKSARQQYSTYGLALTMADVVNRDNSGNTLQIRAQRLVAEVIDQPGVRVEPSVLFEAAEGEYSARQYEAAATAYRRVLRALETESEIDRKEFAPKVHYGLGRSYQRTNRPLEAAMTFREALERYEGDPQFDKQNAEEFLSSVDQLKRRYPSERMIDDLKSEAEGWVLRKVQEEAGDIVYKLARELWSEKSFADARTKFLEVPNSAENFEKAKVYASACSYRLKDIDTARSELNAFINDYVSDPGNALTEDYMIVRRKEALAMGTYYLGRLEYEAQNYQRAIELVSGYSKKFPSQASYGPASHYIAVQAFLKLDDFPGARAEYDQMLAKFPTDRTARAASAKIYKLINAKYLEAVEAGEDAKSEGLLRQMAETMAAGNNAGGKAAYPNLRAEARHWLDLGEFALAEGVLRRIIGSYDRGELDGEKDIDQNVARLIKPDLAHALLEQQKTAEALELLRPLVPDADDPNAAKPDRDTIVDFCRAVAGWVTGDAGVFEEVPGVGDAESMAAAAKWWEKISNSVSEKWTCEWYGYKFNLAYTYYRWSHLDSGQKSTAKKILGVLVSELGSAEFNQVAEGCGDEVLRSRLKQLWALVR